MFILGTSSVFGMIPVDDIDLIAPIPQLLSVGFGPLGAAAAIVPLTLSAMIAIRSRRRASIRRQHAVADGGRVGQPVAGLVHAARRESKTPRNSILFVGTVALVLSGLGLIGVGKQEAFQLLWNSAGIFYGLTYLAMFAIPLFGLKRSSVAAPWWLKACALSGPPTTLLYVTLSVLPIIPVGSRLLFALKIIGLIVVTNLLGLALYAFPPLRVETDSLTKTCFFHMVNGFMKLCCRVLK